MQKKVKRGVVYFTWLTCIIFVLPTTSMERLNVHNSNLMHWLRTGVVFKKCKKSGQVGAW